MDGGKMEERVQNTISEEDWFRNKVYWLSFLFSLLVVWAHSLNGELFVTGEQELETVQQLDGTLDFYEKDSFFYCEIIL